jgi:protein-tyrosine phosphatase
MNFNLFCIRENELYGSELPYTKDDVKKIEEKGIKIVISLTNEITRLKEIIDISDQFEHYELPIADFGVPTKEQAQGFLKIISEAKRNKQPVLVHCLAGCGRTGVMLALAEKEIYGTKNGQKAIAKIRKIRSCAVENSLQEEFVINYPNIHE